MGEAGFLDLIQSEAVDYVQMDMCCQGGVTMARRLFGLVARQDLRMAFHCCATALEVLAAAHLGICFDERVAEWLEYPYFQQTGAAGDNSFPLGSEILKEPLPIERGELIVPRSPGLGIEVDERVIEKFPWMPGPWLEVRIDSPPKTMHVRGDHSLPWEHET